MDPVQGNAIEAGADFLLTDEFMFYSQLGVSALFLIALASNYLSLKASQKGNEYEPLLSSSVGSSSKADIVYQYGSKRRYLKLILTCLVLVVSVVEVYFHNMDVAQTFLHFDTITGLLLLGFAAQIMSVVVLKTEEAYQPSKKASWVNTLYYICNTLVGLPHVYYVIHQGNMSTSAYLVVATACMFIVLSILGLSSSLTEPSRYSYHYLAARESLANMMERLSFSWMSDIMAIGNSRSLEVSDLQEVPDKLKAKENHVRIQEILREDSYHSLTKMTVAYRLVNYLGSYFWITFVTKAISCGLAFAGPYFLNRIIAFIENSHTDNPPPAYMGPLLAFGMFSMGLLKSTIDGQNFWYQNKGMLVLKSCLNSLLFKKTISYSQPHSDIGTGQVTTLLSVDAERISMLNYLAHLLWSTPLMIAFSVYGLYICIGNAAWVGVGVFVFMVPCNMLLSRLMYAANMDSMNSTDARMNDVRELFNSIRIVKFFAWEDEFIKRLQNSRFKEMKAMWYMNCLVVGIKLAFNGAPVLVSLGSFAVYTKVMGQTLNTTTAFTALSLFSILKGPLFMLPMIMSATLNFAVSISRLIDFLKMRDLDPITPTPAKKKYMSVKNANFAWNSEKSEQTLFDINAEFEEGSLNIIAGRTGCGKSSFMMALLGEIEKMSGSVTFNGSIAYVSQEAWIQNATVRDNIVFGKPFDMKKYKEVCKVCCLGPDFLLLDGGDMTEIGEKGINLSGGQKQRISLARAVYADADIIIMDDPLSAVDAHVAKNLFDKCMCGILKNKTRILVSHQLGLVIPKADKVFVMKDGRVAEQGHPDDLMKNGTELKVLMEAFGKTNVSEKEDEEEREYERKAAEDIEKAMTTEFSFKKELVKEESKEEGGVSWDVYKFYFNAIGGDGAAVACVLAFLFRVLFVFMQDNVLRWWAGQYSTHDPADVNVNFWLGLYACVSGISIIMIAVTAILFIVYSYRGSMVIHENLVNTVIRAPVRYFDVTPLGRIINRFSSDIQQVDTMVQSQFYGYLLYVMTMTLTVGTVAYVTPPFLLVLFPLFVTFRKIGQYFMKSSNELKRIHSVTKSPIYSFFTESLNGAATIRAYGQKVRFMQDNYKKIDANNSAFYLMEGTYAWLEFNLALLGTIVIGSSAGFSVLSAQFVNAGLVGMTLNYLLQFSDMLKFLVETQAQLDQAMNHVERVKEFSSMETEPPAIIDHNRPPPSWPTKGKIQFENLQIAYAKDLPPVIKGISLKVGTTQKVGIVGRTGAGKSTITLCLFRFMEPRAGTIRIDGIDIQSIGLYDLRSRITIIPQDPVLFTGTIRSNLDPFNKATDLQLWQALERVYLSDFVKAQAAGLDFKVEENGDNMSVGQRQLLCLARAIVKKTKILIMDEATANVDVETDDLIQKTIMSEFADCTVLTIAHRLKTIIDYDRVLVLDKGYVAEYDTPRNLLNMPDGIFKSMCENSGQYDMLQAKASARRASVACMRRMSSSALIQRGESFVMSPGEYIEAGSNISVGNSLR
eukprot:Nk52_evm10s238 gene=Nk52_evmTU10s238